MSNNNDTNQILQNSFDAATDLDDEAGQDATKESSQDEALDALPVPALRSSMHRTKPVQQRLSHEEVEDNRRLRIAALNAMKAQYAGKVDAADQRIREIYASCLLDVPLVLELSATRRPNPNAPYGGTRVGHNASRLAPPTAQMLRWTGAFIRYAEKVCPSETFLARTNELYAHLRGVYTKEGEHGPQAPRALIDTVQMSADADRLRHANKQNQSVVSVLLADVAWDQVATPIDTAVLLGRVASALISALMSDQLGLDSTTGSYAVMLERALGVSDDQNQ